MTTLSPAAQAVLNAVVPYPIHEAAIAAALRAATDQVVPRESIKDPTWVGEAYKQRQETRAYLLAIATELEAQP
jgi:hypothetical protein